MKPGTLEGYQLISQDSYTQETPLSSEVAGFKKYNLTGEYLETEPNAI